MRVYLKVFILILALMGVVFAIKHVSPDSVSRALMAFGVEPGADGTGGLMAAGRPLQPGEERMSICPNRVRAIIFHGGGHQIEEKDRKWIADDRELAYMQVEKWLSLHCQIVIRWVDGGSYGALSSTEPIEIRYIDGKSAEFIREGGGGHHFSVGDRRFESQDFADALDELKQIAQFK
ncbi:MAG TPA: hypothetical protein VM432_00190 [Bdellovibrionales bacterium]|nr:hypothetical protein [Bdellovibrionales bacterium]